MNKTLSEIWNLRFRGWGMRMTVPRKAIICALLERPGHLSAEDIYILIHQRFPEVGLTTVYRTLELLSTRNVLTKHEFGDRHSRYEMSGEYGAGKSERSRTGHHHHLVCTKCMKVTDYSDFMAEENRLVKNAENGISGKYGFAVASHEINFFGTCGSCARSKGKGK